MTGKPAKVRRKALEVRVREPLRAPLEHLARVKVKDVTELVNEGIVDLLVKYKVWPAPDEGLWTAEFYAALRKLLEQQGMFPGEGG
jgi:spermidine synthase